MHLVDICFAALLLIAYTPLLFFYFSKKRGSRNAWKYFELSIITHTRNEAEKLRKFSPKIAHNGNLIYNIYEVWNAMRSQKNAGSVLGGSEFLKVCD